MRTHYTKTHQTKGGEVIKIKQTEAQLQAVVMRYLAYQYPKVLAIHVPNEGKRSKFTAKKMGIKAGVPDVLIFDSGKECNGLAIELKVRPNSLTPRQLLFLQKLSDRGWRMRVCYSFDEAKKEIDDYLTAA